MQQASRVGLEMLDPILGPITSGGTLSPRLDTLAGKTIGVIWNGRLPGDLILRRVVDILGEKHGIRGMVFRDKPYIGNIAPQEMLDELSEGCDAVITGVGD